MVQGSLSCYQCDEDRCNVPDKQLSFCEKAIYCWKASFRDYDGSLRYARGCIDELENLQLICSSKMQAKNSRYRTECCNKEFCNSGVFPVLNENDESISATRQILLISSVLLVIGFVMIAIFYCQKTDSLNEIALEQRRRRRYQVRSGSGDATNNSNSNLSVIEITPAGDRTINESVDGQSSTSESVPGNLTKQIALVESLSTGSFGPQEPKLWRATWKGKNVMVKIYSPSSKAIWAHETQVYKKLLPLKHDNILEYVGSDTTTVENVTQLWLVTRYQTNGSLVNYLKVARLNQKGVLKACLSLACGLFYLHTVINGKKDKPPHKLPMAHRSLSAKNVFVKNGGVCVIGGLEYVATEERLDGVHFLENASKRYMSPELLQPTFGHEIWSLDDFQQADMYSLSLIFWEICRACVKNEEGDSNYVAPFSEWLGNDEREPTIEEMRTLILNDQRRPEILHCWHTDTIMHALGSMIQECWDTSPLGRLTILQVKKTLSKLSH